MSSVAASQIEVKNGFTPQLGIEIGSGTTKRNTLAHAIDKFDKANDIEALAIAPDALKAYMQSNNERDAASVIAMRLGYPSSEGLLSSGKWDYVSQMLQKEAAEARRRIEDEQRLEEQRRAEEQARQEELRRIEAERKAVEEARRRAEEREAQQRAEEQRREEERKQEAEPRQTQPTTQVIEDPPQTTSGVPALIPAESSLSPTVKYVGGGLLVGGLLLAIIAAVR